jgi:hypothetical protein
LSDGTAVDATSERMTSAQQRKANLRLALILAAVALAFALVFVAKIAWL